MKLSIVGLAIASAILWGGAVLITGFANLIWPEYAVEFLEIIASIYPGYHAAGGFGRLPE